MTENQKLKESNRDLIKSVEVLRTENARLKFDKAVSEKASSKLIEVLEGKFGDLTAVNISLKGDFEQVKSAKEYSESESLKAQTMNNARIDAAKQILDDVLNDRSY